MIGCDFSSRGGRRAAATLLRLSGRVTQRHRQMKATNYLAANHTGCRFACKLAWVLLFLVLLFFFFSHFYHQMLFLIHHHRRNCTASCYTVRPRCHRREQWVRAWKHNTTIEGKDKYLAMSCCCWERKAPCVKIWQSALFITSQR